jgi:hypothetical protein
MIDINGYDDIILSEGDIQLVDTESALRQRTKRRLLTFFGEWFLNRLKGVDYFGKILGIQLQPLQVKAEFRKAILDDPEVTDIDSLSVDITDNVMTVAGEIRTTYGIIQVQEVVSG